MIIRSVLHHNLSAGAPPAAFISRNKRDFQSGYKVFSERFEANVKYFGTEEALERELDAGFVCLAQEIWSKSQDVAESALNSMHSDIQRFLAATFAKGGRVGVRVNRVYYVRTFLLDDSKPGRVPLSFSVDVNFIPDLSDGRSVTIDRTATVTGHGSMKAGTFSEIVFEAAEFTR